MMKRFLRDNALSITMFGLFLLFLVGQSLAGHVAQNETLTSHGQSTLSYGQYLLSGDFIEAVFENWESEFLQMGALVVLTIWLRQKGAPDSKKLNHSQDTHSRYAIIRASTWHLRKKAMGRALYANSLSIALFVLFAASFVAHGLGGVAAHNEEALQHQEAALSFWQFLGTAQFWFESFQNWQSEFLAVGTLVVLSIFLRQRSSPESKAIGEPNSKTGS